MMTFEESKRAKKDIELFKRIYSDIPESIIVSISKCSYLSGELDRMEKIIKNTDSSKVILECEKEKELL